MSFPGGAQAENEPQSAGRQVSLIGVRNDGGIEQRGGFQRVFGQEIGADQEPSLFGQFLDPSTAARGPVRSVPGRACGFAGAAARIRRRLRPGAARLCLPGAP